MVFAYVERSSTAAYLSTLKPKGTERAENSLVCFNKIARRTNSQNSRPQLCGVVLGCGVRRVIMSHYRAWFLFSAKLSNVELVSIRGWVTVTDRGLSHMHGFSAKVPRRVTLTNE